MTQLKASTEQLKAYASKAKNGALADGVVLEIGHAIERIKAKRELKRELEREIDPTRERLSKGGLERVPVYDARGFEIARQYRPKGPVDHYKDHWPDDVLTAFSAYIRDAHAADQTGLTISYDGNTSRGSVAKLGGLGNVHDRMREAFERLEWVNQRLTWGSVLVLRWLVLEVRREVDGRVLGLTDVGHQIFPAIRDKATAKGIAIGRLLGAGEELARVYRLYEVLSRDSNRPPLKEVR